MFKSEIKLININEYTSLYINGVLIVDKAPSVICAETVIWPVETEDILKTIKNKHSVSFETEYALQEFRKRQSEYFDKDGDPIPYGWNKSSMIKVMFDLINQLEAELKKWEKWNVKNANY